MLRNRFGSGKLWSAPRLKATSSRSTLASRDGEPLEDAAAEDVEHTIGSGQMLEGLDDAVTGLSAGESATFVSTLVSGPLKDEEADIQVTVTKVQALELPDADDEFAQQASEFDTIEELRSNIKERLTGLPDSSRRVRLATPFWRTWSDRLLSRSLSTSSTPRSTIAVSRSLSNSDRQG